MANQQKSPFANALTGARNSMSTEVESPSGASNTDLLARALFRKSGGNNEAGGSNLGGGDIASRFDVPEQAGPNAEQAGPTPEEIAEQERNAAHMAALRKQEEQQQVFDARAQRAQMEIDQLRQHFLRVAAQTKPTRVAVDSAKIKVQVNSEGTADGAVGVTIWMEKFIAHVTRQVESAHSADRWVREAQAKKAKKGPKGAGHGAGLENARGVAEVTSELNDLGGDENWAGNVGE